MGDPLSGKTDGVGNRSAIFAMPGARGCLWWTTGFFARECSIPLVSSAVHAAANTGVSPLPLVGRNDRLWRQVVLSTVEAPGRGYLGCPVLLWRCECRDPSRTAQDDDEKQTTTTMTKTNNDNDQKPTTAMKGKQLRR
jgi:hypothetical protein